MQNKDNKFILENMHIVMHLATTYNTSKHLPPSWKTGVETTPLLDSLCFQAFSPCRDLHFNRFDLGGNTTGKKLSFCGKLAFQQLKC